MTTVVSPGNDASIFRGVNVEKDSGKKKSRGSSFLKSVSKRLSGGRTQGRSRGRAPSIAKRAKSLRKRAQSLGRKKAALEIMSNTDLESVPSDEKPILKKSVSKRLSGGRTRGRSRGRAPSIAKRAKSLGKRARSLGRKKVTLESLSYTDLESVPSDDKPKLVTCSKSWEDEEKVEIVLSPVAVQPAEESCKEEASVDEANEEQQMFNDIVEKFVLPEIPTRPLEETNEKEPVETENEKPQNVAAETQTTQVPANDDPVEVFEKEPAKETADEQKGSVEPVEEDTVAEATEKLRAAPEDKLVEVPSDLQVFEDNSEETIEMEKLALVTNLEMGPSKLTQASTHLPLSELMALVLLGCFILFSQFFS